MQTTKDPAECVRVFQECLRKRPLKLRPFPFICDTPQVSADRSRISASFKIAEPYGVVVMRCERRGDTTLVEFATDGNIRGRMTANSMAKHIASRLS